MKTVSVCKLAVRLVRVSETSALTSSNLEFTATFTDTSVANSFTSEGRG